MSRTPKSEPGSPASPQSLFGSPKPYDNARKGATTRNPQPISREELYRRMNQLEKLLETEQNPNNIDHLKNELEKLQCIEKKLNQRSGLSLNT